MRTIFDWNAREYDAMSLHRLSLIMVTFFWVKPVRPTRAMSDLTCVFPARLWDHILELWLIIIPDELDTISPYISQSTKEFSLALMAHAACNHNLFESCDPSMWLQSISVGICGTALFNSSLKTMWKSLRNPSRSTLGTCGIPITRFC